MELNLRGKIFEILVYEKDNPNRAVDLILTLPEIARALKAYEFADVAIRDGRGGPEPMPTDESTQHERPS